MIATSSIITLPAAASRRILSATTRSSVTGNNYTTGTCQHWHKRQRRRWKSNLWLPGASSSLTESHPTVLSSRRLRLVGSSSSPLRTYTPRSSFRSISTKAARQLLGLPLSSSSSNDNRPITVRELRAAYFEAAKKTHPDLMSNNNDIDSSGDSFRRVTEAYERLLHSREVVVLEVSDGDDNRQGGDHHHHHHHVISRQEEDEYRQACIQVLGIPAEIVEESKSNPMFRHWLGGNTDGAQHWRAFFSVHGGLAQKLRRPKALIGSGQQQEISTVATRRRRKR